jgi:anti-sigma factor ChrR (cupin superfamily)
MVELETTAVEKALVIADIFDADHLLQSRSWTSLRPGVAISLIYAQEGDGPQAGFLHYQPGASVPRHEHMGLEHILILHGSQSDGEQLFTKGSLVVQHTQSEHAIISEEGCIALGIWQKPVRFVDL